MEMTPEPLTRPEHDAKLQASEARMDAKMDRLESRMDRLEGRMDALADKVDALTVILKDFMVESRETSRSLRWWIAGMVATVILSIPATYAVNWSIVQSVTAVYEAGRNVAPRP